VTVNIDTEVHPELINRRFDYGSVSRASPDAQIYTSDAGSLAIALSHDATNAQGCGLINPWAHDLDQLMSWIDPAKRSAHRG